VKIKSFLPFAFFFLLIIILLFVNRKFSIAYSRNVLSFFDLCIELLLMVQFVFAIKSSIYQKKFYQKIKN